MSDTPRTDKLKAEYYAASEPNERAYLHLFEALATDLERKLEEWKDNASRDIKSLTLQLENSNRQLAEAQKDSDRLDWLFKHARVETRPPCEWDDGKQLMVRQDVDKAKEDSPAVGDGVR